MIADSGRPRLVELGEALGRVEAEIRQATAEALGRVGERLEVILGQLARIDPELDHTRAAATPGAPIGRVVAHVAARNRLRDEAARLVRDLVIQREAIGILHHSAVGERYAVPPPYRLDTGLGRGPEASGRDSGRTP